MKMHRANEKGSTLVLVMLIIGALVTFGTISIYSAADKYIQVSKERLEREATHLADAGVSQGAAQLKLDDADGFNDSELTSAYPEEDVTIDSVEYEIHRWIDTTTVDTGKKFKVWLADNDDFGYTGDRSNDDIPKPKDNYDEDRAVVLVSRGWVEDGSANVRASAIIKGLFKRVPSDPEYAILTGGDLAMNGSISVTGSTPSIHTNSNLTSIGSADVSEGAVTASGTMTGEVDLTGGGTTGTGNEPLVDIPTIVPEDYRSMASSLAIDITDINTVASRPPGGAGDLYENVFGTECLFLYRAPPDTAVTVHIDFSSGCPGSSATAPLSGVIYINGNVILDISGPWSGVVLASGSIELSTNTTILGSPDLEGVGLVAGGEISFSGGVTVGSPTNQLGMYTGTSFDFSGGGNKTLYGPMIANDVFSTSSLSGNITIVYDNDSPPANGPLIGKLISWSQVE